jgi:hypothetical protein
LMAATNSFVRNRDTYLYAEGPALGLPPTPSCVFKIVAPSVDPGAKISPQTNILLEGPPGAFWTASSNGTMRCVPPAPGSTLTIRTLRMVPVPKVAGLAISKTVEVPFRDTGRPGPVTKTESITLDVPAPPGGVTVLLECDQETVTVPGSVTLSAGHHFKEFPVRYTTTALPLSCGTRVAHISASLAATDSTEVRSALVSEGRNPLLELAFEPEFVATPQGFLPTVARIIVNVPLRPRMSATTLFAIRVVVSPEQGALFTPTGTAELSVIPGTPASIGGTVNFAIPPGTKVIPVVATRADDTRIFKSACLLIRNP